jgi:membrane protease YdiL (CAAX protease family)
MTETLRPGDYRFVAICAVICIASLLIGTRYFQSAFPESSIDFRVDRGSSESLAIRYLADQGIHVDGCRHATSFRYEDEAKIYLERELGLERTNALVSGEVKLWRWSHRWFKPLQKEEIQAEVTPAGDLASFSHSLPENAPGANLPAMAARGIAESFLVLEMKRPIDSIEFVDSESEKRLHRTDHIFTWKIPSVDLGSASYRITVTVQGDRVDSYNEYINIPDEWRRNYSRMRSLNESTSQVDLLFFALLGIGMLVTLLQRVRLRDIRWRTAAAFGAISAILQFLASLNEFPLALYNFDTASTYGSFLGETILGAALNAISLGGAIMLLTACAEPLYREDRPAGLSISRMFTWQAIRTRSFFLASLAGITLTFFFFSYEIGFYLLANRFGAWAPAEIPYTDLLNTRFPWVYVLLGGFFPAVSEEWAFRAFSIPFLGKLLKRRWVAVVVASFIWGFGHANYPNQPFFIRGLEVGIVGLILSWAMMRFGILAPLIAHYSIDAFYAAFLLLRSGNPYFVASGAVTAGINLVPLVLAAGAYILRKGFAPETGLVNGTQTVAPAPVPSVPEAPELHQEPAYVPLGRKAALAVAAFLAFSILLVQFSPQKFGRSVRFVLAGKEAIASAQRFLSGQGFTVEGYRSGAHTTNRYDQDPTAAQYVYNHAGIHGLNALYTADLIPAVWQARFYRPLEKEEFRVYIDPSSGRPVAFSHLQAEDAPGADLPVSRAQEIAVSFLRGQGVRLKQFELKDIKSEKPKFRRDTSFVWEALPGNPGAVGDARLRVEGGVMGNRIGWWTQSVRIPEDWRRLREGRNFYEIAITAIRTVYLSILFAVALLVLVRGTRHGVVPWKTVSGIAASAMALDLAAALNSIPLAMSRYTTQIEPRIFVISDIVLTGVQLIGIGLFAAFASALVLTCYPQTRILLKVSGWRQRGRDAVVASAASVAVLLFLEWCSATIEFHANSLALAPSLNIPDSIGTYIPFLTAIRGILLSAFFYSAVMAFSVFVWEHFPGTRIRALLLLGLGGSLLPGSAVRPPEIVLDAIPSLLLVGSIFVLAKTLLRNNAPAYFASAAVFSAARASYSLIGQGNPGLVVQGYLIAVLTCSGLVWLWMQFGRPPSPDRPLLNIS